MHGMINHHEENIQNSSKSNYWNHHVPYIYRMFIHTNKKNYLSNYSMI